MLTRQAIHEKLNNLPAIINLPDVETGNMFAHEVVGTQKVGNEIVALKLRGPFCELIGIDILFPTPLAHLTARELKQIEKLNISC